MSDIHLDIMEPGGTHETDVIIIGAGPAGLFAVFELGLLDIKAHVIDVLTKPGGQCAELYPEKPIYDIPCIPSASGQEITDGLLAQIKPFHPAFHFGQMAESMTKLEDGRFSIVTSQGTTITATVIVIAAGGGSFVPRRPRLPGMEPFENKSIFYSVRRIESYRDKNILICGGGDSALDWSLALQPVARSMTLLHRRSDFRAAPDSVRKLLELVDHGKVNFYVGEIAALNGTDGQLETVTIKREGGQEVTMQTDVMLPFYGLTMTLGPIANFGTTIEKELIPVDTAKFETSVSGIFAIGDINTYPGKLKLILSGFHEAALMAQEAFHYCRPGKTLRFQYTTSSSTLQARLGVEKAAKKDAAE